MNAAEWLMLGALALTLLTTIAGGCYIAGRHSQRIDTHDHEISNLKTKTDAHSTAIADITGMKDLLREVREDVKAMMGRSRTGRSGGSI
jgi:hypothetical protein